MHTPRTAPTAPATRRSSALLALALAATTGLAVLAPATPGSASPAAAAVTEATSRVVVSGAGGVAAAAAAVQSVGGTVLDHLPLVGGVAAEMPTTAVLPPSFVVVPDRPLELSGLTEAAAPAVSTVRETVGLTRAPAGEGAGITVAVVDTGVATGLADLTGRVSHVDVSGDGSTAGEDGYGHGTFVAGLVAGDGAASNGAYSGVAPAARILDVKVADNDGVTDLITVLRGLEVVARSKDRVDVVSLALSSGSPLPYQLDPLGVALQALWQRGTVVVVPAGNTGGKVTSPGSHPVLLTAGGLDEARTADRSDDTVASWSARGPAAQGVPKPDLVAPGTSVVSLLAPGSDAAGHKTDLSVPPAYLRGSGTSFSTAVTAGAAAVLLSERKNLDPDQVKSLLTGTAYTAAGLNDAKAAGAGGLDVAAARTAPAPKSTKRQPATPVPGGPKGWSALLDAFLNDDPEAAANSWSALTPAARHWAARHWAELTPEARHWALEQWTARHWADSGTSAEEWAARHWAARHWATEEWAARHWAGNGAVDPEWNARHWAARHWAGDGWEARHWADDSWVARHWAARHWAADEWSARHWADGEWVARHWAADDWAARHWASSSWSARHWASVDWR